MDFELSQPGKASQIRPVTCRIYYSARSIKARIPHSALGTGKLLLPMPTTGQDRLVQIPQSCTFAGSSHASDPTKHSCGKVAVWSIMDGNRFRRDPMGHQHSHPQSMAGKNFANANLAGKDFRGVELRGANFAGADLRGANLELADLAGANLVNAELTNANLAWTNLAGAALNEADLSGADLREARLNGAILENALLDGTNLTSASLRGADLSGASLRDACLEGTWLEGVTGFRTDDPAS